MARTTSKYIYRYDYQPIPGGIFVTPCLCIFCAWDEERTIESSRCEQDRLLHCQTTPEGRAAVIIEPVLGEGGYIPAPAGCLREFRSLCTQNDILLIADEVQSGFGRTGKFFVIEQAGVEPDIIVMANGWGSGLPISGIAASQELMTAWKSGAHGGTYGGGSTLASTTALATFHIILEEKLGDNRADMGELLMKNLRGLQERHPLYSPLIDDKSQIQEMLEVFKFALERVGQTRVNRVI